MAGPSESEKVPSLASEFPKAVGVSESVKSLASEMVKSSESLKSAASEIAKSSEAVKQGLASQMAKWAESYAAVSGKNMFSEFAKSMAEMVPVAPPPQITARNFFADLADENMASEFYKRLQAQIKKFDAELDPEHEVGVKLVTFGQAVTFHVSRLGYHNPSLIFFYGLTEGGDEIQLIQHVSQINFVLVKLPKLNPDEPKRPFGFAQGHEPPADAESQLPDQPAGGA
jgi:hypothetical protein